MRVVAAAVVLLAFGFAATHAAPAKGKARAKAAATKSIVLKSGMKLAEAVNKLGKHVIIRSVDVEWAKQYTLPPCLVGKKLEGGGDSTALTFLFGAGWEGSRLPEPQRSKGKNYEIARTPFAYVFDGETYSVCNNRMWDWKAEDNKIVVSRRVKDDGDLVGTKKCKVAKIRDDFTLGTLLDELNRQTGVNVTNIFGRYHVAEKALGKGKAPEVEMPMTASSIPTPLQKRLTGGVTVGEFLSIMCIGLNKHTQQLGGDWKWSSAHVGDRPVYTLRDYAHVN